MSNYPVYIDLVFILTTFLTVFLFFRASGNNRNVLLLLMLWLVVQALISRTGFYQVTDTIPPRFALTLAPAVLFIIGMFVTQRGRQFIDTLNQAQLTQLHIIRIPVELVLYWLYLSKGVPQRMTFEGVNYDILSGISAGFVWYFGYVKRSLSRNILIAWNVVCLILLFNIVINAILSAPFRIQKFAFDQPDVALLVYPYTWLPCCVVPIVLLSHLTCLRQLSRGLMPAASR